MPHFYFEMSDGKRAFDDPEGSDHCSAEAARKELVAALALMARDELPDGNIRNFTDAAKDADGKDVFKAALSLRSGWVE